MLIQLLLSLSFVNDDIFISVHHMVVLFQHVGYCCVTKCWRIVVDSQFQSAHATWISNLSSRK